MKKLVIKSAFLIVVLTVICSMSIGLMVSTDADGWFTHNEHLDADSNVIYSINQDYGADFSSLDDIPKIYIAENSISKVTYIPGDVVYYTFIFKMPVESLVSTKTDYYVNPIIDIDVVTEEGEEYEGEYGDYLSFGYNLCLEENAVLLVVLEKGTTTIAPSDEEVESFTPIKYHYDATSGKVVRGADGDNTYSYFGSETTHATFTSTGVEHFCDGVSKDSLNANFSCVFPILDTSEYPIFTEGEGEDAQSYVYFMLYIPIWYVDIEVEQNQEMDCVLTISGCAIWSVDPDEPEEPEEPEPTDPTNPDPVE